MTETNTPRFGRGWAILALLASGGLAFFATTRPWWQTTIATAGLPKTDVAVAGSSVVPWAVGVALVVMAAALGVLAGAPAVRRVIGAIVLILSIAAVVGISVTSAADAQQASLDAAAVSGAQADWESTLWRWLAVLGFAGAAVSGVWAALKAQNWTSMSSRYEAPSASQTRDEADVWKMIDQGIDPTEEQAQ